MPIAITELHELARLHRAGQTGSATAQRHVIVIGVLVTRLCFVYGVPQRRGRLSQPRDPSGRGATLRRPVDAVSIRAQLSQTTG